MERVLLCYLLKVHELNLNLTNAFSKRTFSGLWSLLFMSMRSFNYRYAVLIINFGEKFIRTVVCATPSGRNYKYEEKFNRTMLCTILTHPPFLVLEVLYKWSAVILLIVQK